MDKTPIDFLIYGPPKTGSSSLTKYLLTHPNITTHSQSNEPDFFIRESISEKDIQDYSNYFCKDNTLKFEKSTSYFNNEIALLNIQKFCRDDIKYVVCLRNPVEVIVSYYIHFKALSYILRNDQTINTLIEISNRDGWKFERMSEKNTNYFINIPNFDEICTDKVSEFTWIKQIGIYEQHLTRLFNAVDPNNIKIILYEDWKKNNIKTIFDIFSFLKLDFDTGMYQTTIIENTSQDWINHLYECGIIQNPQDDILDKHIELLQQFFYPHNQKLKLKFNIEHTWDKNV